MHTQKGGDIKLCWGKQGINLVNTKNAAGSP